MKCIHCDTEMITANMETEIPSGSVFFLWNKKKGILNPMRKSPVIVYVCPECGYIELRADKPKILIIEK